MTDFEEKTLEDLNSYKELSEELSMGDNIFFSISNNQNINKFIQHIKNVSGALNGIEISEMAALLENIKEHDERFSGIDDTEDFLDEMRAVETSIYYGSDVLSMYDEEEDVFNYPY